LLLGRAQQKIPGATQETAVRATGVGVAMTYDYIIVGGGSAGSVMAHLLSAKSANQVRLHVRW